MHRAIPSRILLAKVGLDGHDRGIRMIARELMTRGAEVILLGTGSTPADIAAAAVEEDVDVVGISILSGAHIALVPRVIQNLRDLDADIPVVCGGTIPPDDEAALRLAGVHRVISTGATVIDAAEALLGARGNDD